MKTGGCALKISAALIAWNEVDTIDLCIKSLKGFTDEIIVADTGSFDGTRKKAIECLTEHNISGEVLDVKSNTLGQARLSAIDKITHDWILLIDGNLVLSKALKQELRHAQLKGFLGMVRSLNLMGDYEHYFTTLPLHSHHDTLFHKTMVTWVDDKDRPTPLVGRLPLKRWAVNLSRVRLAWRYWLRGEAFTPETGREFVTEGNRQHKWLRSGKYKNLLDYVKATEKMTFQDIQRVSPDWFLEMLQKHAKPLPPRYRRWLPETIQEEQKNPRYSLIYEGGRIVGRYPRL